MKTARRRHRLEDILSVLDLQNLCAMKFAVAFFIFNFQFSIFNSQFSIK
jgi:hypothetical protein